MLSTGNERFSYIATTQTPGICTTIPPKAGFGGFFAEFIITNVTFGMG